MSAPDIAAVCASIRDRFTLSAVAAQAGVKLSRAGREWKACCPFHNDRSPSFTIYADDRRFCCFGCAAEGDVLDFVRRSYRVGLLDAVSMLDGGALRELEHQSAQPTAKPDTVKSARRIWRAAGPIEGTPAAAYLRRRGITIELPPTLRFARLRPPQDSGVAQAGGVGPLPAMVALVTGPDDRVCGVQRTFLTDAGEKAASVDRKVKFSLGNVKGGAIRLAPAGPELAICEGVEDALSLVQLGAPVAWAAGGTAMLPAMRLPEAARSVVIGGDANAAGRRAADKAARAFTEQGRTVRVIYPNSPAVDFNDELTGAGQ